MTRKLIPEASPDTPMGSVTHDLLQSKLWLCDTLQDLGYTSFDNIYILGSWYGALALLIKRMPFEWKNIICVDKDLEKTRYVEHLIDKHNLKGIHAISTPAEKLKYKGSKILVINTSTNDIVGTDWMNRIPWDSLVVIQGRDNQEISNGVETLRKFDREYPLEKTTFLDEITVMGVEGEPYQRFMKIGFL